MPVPANLVFIHDGTNLSISTGWARETTLDGLYVKGAPSGLGGGATGGQATHTHTSPPHTHEQDPHNHVFRGLTGSGTQLVTPLPNTGFAHNPNHDHRNAVTNNATITNQDATVTFQAVSNDPAFHEVIFVRSLGTNDISDDMLGWWDDAPFPSGWNLADGLGGRSDLRDRFLKGAGTLQDAGAEGGSNSPHTHPETSPHTHAQDPHDHGGTQSEISIDPSLGFFAQFGNNVAINTHRHPVTIQPSAGANDVSSVTLGTSDGLPLFRKLQVIQNETGGESTPQGIIGLHLQALASVPGGWRVLDGSGGTLDMRDRFHRGAATAGEVDQAGGTTQHAHTAAGHTHRAFPHTHGGVGGAATVSVSSLLGITPRNDGGSHNHAWQVDNATPPNKTSFVMIDPAGQAETYPPHMEVLFVQFVGSAGERLKAMMGVGQ